MEAGWSGPTKHVKPTAETTISLSQIQVNTQALVNYFCALGRSKYFVFLHYCNFLNFALCIMYFAPHFLNKTEKSRTPCQVSGVLLVAPIDFMCILYFIFSIICILFSIFCTLYFVFWRKYQNQYSPSTQVSGVLLVAPSASSLESRRKEFCQSMKEVATQIKLNSEN